MNRRWSLRDRGLMKKLSWCQGCCCRKSVGEELWGALEKVKRVRLLVDWDSRSGSGRRYLFIANEES